MAERLTYNHLHVLADAIARLEEQIMDGADPTQTYVTTITNAQGVFHPDHPLRNLDSYNLLLAQAGEAITDLLGETGDDDAVVIEVHPYIPAESIF